MTLNIRCAVASAELPPSGSVAIAGRDRKVKMNRQNPNRFSIVSPSCACFRLFKIVESSLSGWLDPTIGPGNAANVALASVHA
jgi:hypothetical protein